MALPNVHHIHNWELVFTNIPTISDNNDLKYIHNYIKDFSLPGYSNEITASQFLNSSINNPVTKANTNLSPLTVTFTCSEDMQNYLFFFEWMMNIKYGLVDNPIIRKEWIKGLNLRVYDNEKRDIAKIEFSHLFLNDLSGITLSYQDSSETVFTATFVYEEVKFERIII